MNAVDTFSTLMITVKARELFEAQLNLKGEKLQEIIDKYTQLSTNQGLGSSYGQKNQNQLTELFEGSDMTWNIEMSKDKSNVGFSVYLDSIKEEGSGFFKKITKVGNSINGIVTSNPGMIGKTENYIINFYIKKGDEISQILPIDPRIRIKQ